MGIDNLEHGFEVNTQLDPGKRPDLCPDTRGGPTFVSMTSWTACRSLVRSRGNRFRVFTRISIALVSLLLVAILGLTFLILRPPIGSSTMKLLGTTPIPATTSLLSGTDYAAVRGGTLYVAYGSTGNLLAMDTHTSELSTFASHLDGLHGVAFSDDPAYAFVSEGGANQVAVLEAEGGTLVRNITAGENPDGIVYDSKDGLAYVGSGKSDSATLIPARTLDQAYTIPLGGSPEFPQVDETTGLIYQPLENTNEVVVIDPHQHGVVRRFPVTPCESPKGSAIDMVGRVLLVGCSNRILAVLSLEDGHLGATVPIGRFVDVVAWDAGLHRAYTANAATMTVIQQTGSAEYAVLDTVRTKAGGHTLAVDSATHRVYVISSGLRGGLIATYEPRRESLQP